MSNYGEMTSSYKGRHAEITTMAALMAKGYTVSEPVTTEPFDLTFKKPGEKRTYYVQVKTIYVRDSESYNGKWYITRGSKNNGKVYTKDEVDYFAAVLGNDVWLLENNEQYEYWVRPEEVSKKWRKIT